MFKKQQPQHVEWGIQEHLINELRMLFPDQSPTLGMPRDEIWFRAGQASVVKKLELMQKE